MSKRGRRRSWRRLLVFGIALSTIVVGSACTAGDADPPPRTTVEQTWTAGGVNPVSAVENVGEVAVVYGTAPDGPSIHGIDPATGAEQWKRPAVTMVAVDHAWVVEVDDTVAYLRPTGTRRVSQLVLADPATGDDLTVSDARYWASYPAECPDDAGWVCASSYTQAADGRWLQQPFRVERATGLTVPTGDTPENTPDDAYEIPVVDLFFSFPGDDTAMTIGRAEGGAAVWSAPASEIFGPQMPAPRYFWYDDPNGGERSTFTAIGRGDRLDLAKDLSTASISLPDGAVAWTRPGSWHGCGLQPSLTWDRAAADGEPDAYLCSYTGFAERDPVAAPGSRFTTSELSVTIEHIDSETGAVSWSRELGDAKPLAADGTGGDTALFTDDQLFVPNSAGGVILDLESGHTRSPSPEDTFWCLSQQTFPLPEPFFDASTPTTSGDRLGIVRPCGADGQDAPIPTTSIPSDIGVTFASGVRVVAMPDAVVGLLVPQIDQPATPATPTPPSPTASAAAPIESVSTVERAWAAEGFAAKTTPIMIGGSAVLYGTVGSELFLIGLDPVTGAERWRHPASAASIAPGYQVRVIDIDGQIAYLRPGEPTMPRLTRIALIDPVTGADFLVTELRWWDGLPAICADDPASLCAAANYVSLDNTVADGDFRIDRSTGAITLIPGAATAATGPPAEPWTALWDDLVEVGGAPVETVGMVTDDQLVWSAPLSEIFRPGATLDHGWYASKDNGNRTVFQLSAVVGWAGDGQNYPALDLAANLMTVGIDAADGTVLWREAGTSPQCRYQLPDVRKMSTPGSPDPALRCRYTGRLDSAPPGRNYGLTDPTDVTVTLERVDLQTGKAVWSVPLGAEAALATDGNGPATPIMDDHRILAGGLVVDLDDGSSRPPAVGEIFWCPGPQAFEQSVEWYGNDGSVRTDRRAEGEVFTCDSSGNPSPNPPVAVPLAVSTVTDEQLRLVATPNGVVAFRVPL